MEMRANDEMRNKIKISDCLLQTLFDKLNKQLEKTMRVASLSVIPGSTSAPSPSSRVYRVHREQARHQKMSPPTPRRSTLCVSACTSQPRR